MTLELNTVGNYDFLEREFSKRLQLKALALDRGSLNALLNSS